MSIFGWFDSPTQSDPAFDPGLEVCCPFCLKTLSRPMVSIGLLKEGSEKSYFYRAHKNCYEGAAQSDIDRIDWSLIDSDF